MYSITVHNKSKRTYSNCEEGGGGFSTHTFTPKPHYIDLRNAPLLRLVGLDTLNQVLDSDNIMLAPGNEAQDGSECLG